MFNILANNANTECIVHGLVEEVPVELDDVLVVLSLEKLDSLLFVLVKFVKRFSFDLFERVIFARSQVQHFIYLGIFLAISKQVDLFEILLPKHCFMFLFIYLNSNNLNYI